MAGDKRILIVDDERTLTHFLREALLADGESEYEVQTAVSGEEALQLLQSHPFDLLIADLKMSGINGLQLIEAVRQIDPSTRTILMTAYGSEKVERQAHDLSVFRYLPKPFALEDLQHAVRDALVSGGVTGAGFLMLSAEYYEVIARRLYALQSDTGCQCVFLADLVGQIIVQTGSAPDLVLSRLATIIGERFATTFEMSRLLRSTNVRNLDFHESDEHSIYSTNVGDTLVLTLLFYRRVRSSRVGTVWEHAKHTVDDLLTTMAAVKAAGGEPT